MVATSHKPVVLDIMGRPHKGLDVRLLDEPDLVIIMAGTNDLAKGFSPEETMTAVAQLHEKCHMLGIKTVAVAPPAVVQHNIMRSREKLAGLLQRWSQSRAGRVALFIDAEHMVPRSHSHYWEPDGLHFSPAGSREFGRRLARALRLTLYDLPERQVSGSRAGMCLKNVFKLAFKGTGAAK